MHPLTTVGMPSAAPVARISSARVIAALFASSSRAAE
jgi:hypothetical protein